MTAVALPGTSVHTQLSESCWLNVTDVAWGFSLAVDGDLVGLLCARCPGGGPELSWRIAGPFPMAVALDAMRRHHHEHHSPESKEGS